MKRNYFGGIPCSKLNTVYNSQIKITENCRMNIYVYLHIGDGLVAQSYLTLVTPWTIIHQALLTMEFSRQDYLKLLVCKFIFAYQ